VNCTFRIIGLVATSILLSSSNASAQTTQEHVHDMSSGVMPFEMDKTVHVFEMTSTGGVQQVIIRNETDEDQLAMIRQHLAHEAQLFQNGNFGDPEKLHGENMPGLDALREGASEIRIFYSPIPLGAEIHFETNDIHLITAIHRWFGAQLSEHGADATSG
jgi:hypothetical protein